MTTEFVQLSGNYEDDFDMLEEICQKTFIPEDFIDLAKRDIIEAMIAMDGDSPYHTLEYMKYAYYILTRVQEVLRHLP